MQKKSRWLNEINDLGGFKINQIYQIDCLDGMKRLPTNCVDLIITDPPYGINVAKNGFVGGKNLCESTDYGKQEWDCKIPSKEVFSEMLRISKNQIIFGGNYFVEYLKNSPCWIVWDKDNTGNFADCELAWTSFSASVRKFKFRWNGMIQEDMKNKEKRFHPTQKPVGLFRRIIKNYSEANSLILDPFLGSGTTAIACNQLNRKFIGFELNPKYVDIANKRIKPLLDQQRLSEF
jgi:site-specific DNA-methyltransferase (adenine-specific)